MSKGKYKFVLLVIVVLIAIFGVSYAFFEYYNLSNNHQLIVGNIYLKLNDGTSSLSLENIFPETKEEARARTDNQITFSLIGKNTTTDNDIYYEILLNEGDEETGLTRFKPEHMVFDLIEVDENGNETLVVDALSVADFNEQRLWVNTINRATTTEINRTYKLRMWLDEDVIISDTNPNADYSTSVFENNYASIKVSVYGDFVEKNIPLVVDNEDTYVENNKSYFYATISNYLNDSDVGQNANDNMQLTVTSSNPNVLFSYKDSEGNVVEDTTSELNISYLFNKKKNVAVQVFVTTANDANAETELRFKLIQNGETIQDYYEDFTVIGNNFCLNNGFTKLYDCILASDSLVTDIETAKVNIEAKGEPNLNDTAPTYTYVEDITYDVENVYSYSLAGDMHFADSYEFNSSTGTFKLVNVDGSSVVYGVLSDDYKDYYTCGNNGKNYSTCSTIYRVDATSVSGTTYTITQGDRITYKISSNLESEVGLYKTEDDDGGSYFYRGDVTNNNVLFGGYYWKIIRTNGDNSIRMIYSGESANATGIKTSINNKYYPYIAEKFQDPTYGGYMYGKHFALQTSEVTMYDNFSQTQQYYWADGYEFDAENEVFKLKKVNLDLASGTFLEMKDSFTSYPYTCLGTSETVSCKVLLKVISFVNNSQVNVQYISYSSTSKDGTRTNEVSSDAKVEIENWYLANIVGKQDDNGILITDYIVDGTFCNDRSISSGSGYLLTPDTNYASYTRLTPSNKTATLKCSTDTRDQFSATESKGNGLLDYPVALITADEIALAGGKFRNKNEYFYLNNGGSYYTMTPARLHSSNAGLFQWFITGTGEMDIFSFIINPRCLRPVINLSKDVLIASGDGTIENPFQLKLS